MRGACGAVLGFGEFHGWSVASSIRHSGGHPRRGMGNRTAGSGPRPCRSGAAGVRRDRCRRNAGADHPEIVDRPRSVPGARCGAGGALRPSPRHPRAGTQRVSGAGQTLVALLGAPIGHACHRCAIARSDRAHDRLRPCSVGLGLPSAGSADRARHRRDGEGICGCTNQLGHRRSHGSRGCHR